MKTHKWNDLKGSKLSPSKLAKVTADARRELLEMDLRTLREEAGMTQMQVAEAADMAQAELSKFERRDDHFVSTLRRYVEALGGELEVVAVLGNKRITLTGV